MKDSNPPPRLFSSHSPDIRSQPQVPPVFRLSFPASRSRLQTSSLVLNTLAARCANPIVRIAFLLRPLILFALSRPTSPPPLPTDYCKTRIPLSRRPHTYPTSPSHLCVQRTYAHIRFTLNNSMGLHRR